MLERLKKRLGGQEADPKIVQKLRVLEDANDKIVLNLLRKMPARSESSLLAGVWASASVPQKEKEVFAYMNRLDERGLRLSRSSQYYRRLMENALEADALWKECPAENLYLYCTYKSEPASRKVIRLLVFEE